MRLKEIVVEPYEFLRWPTETEVLRAIGHAGGITHGKDDDLLLTCKNRTLDCIKKGHHSILEHVNLSVWCLVDRGTSHALVRHRHIAITQESTLYTKYKDGIEVVSLPTHDPITHRPVHEYPLVELAEGAEEQYLALLKGGCPNVLARDVLPTNLATRLVITTNLREWYHILKLRKSPADSVRMHCFAFQLENALKSHYPIIHEAMMNWNGAVV